MLSFFKRKRDKNLTGTLPPNLPKSYSFEKKDALTLLDMIKREFGLDYTKQEYITIKKLETFAKNNSIENYKMLTEKYHADNMLKKEL